MRAQLKQFAGNDMLVAVFPNLSTLSTTCLSMPVATATVKQCFSQMEVVKTRLRNHIGERSLSNLMKIAIESSEKLSDDINK